MALFLLEVSMRDPFREVAGGENLSGILTALAPFFTKANCFALLLSQLRSRFVLSMGVYKCRFY
jgi:hypothetical protein